jgi:hypothetical protein
MQCARISRDAREATQPAKALSERQLEEHKDLPSDTTGTTDGRRSGPMALIEFAHASRVDTASARHTGD